MSLIKQYLQQTMDFHNWSLNLYEQDQIRIDREEKEREDNPSFYWHVIQKDPTTGEEWEDYLDTEAEAMDLIAEAKSKGFQYEWERYTDIEYPC